MAGKWNEEHANAWRLIHANKYVSRKKRKPKADEIFVCSCRADSAGCGVNCLNRMMMVVSFPTLPGNQSHRQLSSFLRNHQWEPQELKHNPFFVAGVPP